MNGSESRLVQALERFASRDVEEMRAGNREIREALHGNGDHQGLLHMVREQLLPQVLRHERTLHGPHGGAGLVAEHQSHGAYVASRRRIERWLILAFGAQALAVLAWLLTETHRMITAG